MCFRFPLYDNVLSQQRINGQDVPIITTPKAIYNFLSTELCHVIIR